MNTIIYNQFLFFFLMKMKINTLFLQMILKTWIEKSVFIILNPTLYNCSLSRFNSVIYFSTMRIVSLQWTLFRLCIISYKYSYIKMVQLSVCLLVNSIKTTKLNGLIFCLEMAYILVTSSYRHIPSLIFYTVSIHCIL